jgi:hypothetical protein
MLVESGLEAQLTYVLLAVAGLLVVAVVVVVLILRPDDPVH